MVRYRLLRTIFGIVYSIGYIYYHITVQQILNDDRKKKFRPKILYYSIIKLSKETRIFFLSKLYIQPIAFSTVRVTDDIFSEQDGYSRLNSEPTTSRSIDLYIPEIETHIENQKNNKASPPNAQEKKKYTPLFSIQSNSWCTREENSQHLGRGWKGGYRKKLAEVDQL